MNDAGRGNKDRLEWWRNVPATARLWLVSVAGLLLPCASAAATNLLFNPGFEVDVAGQAQSLPGWQTFGANNYSLNGPSTAHSGTNCYKVYQAFTGAGNYTGIYQDQASGPGAVYAAGGWAYTKATDAPAGQDAAWIEVTFRDATGNMLALYRSVVMTTNQLAGGQFPKNTWVYLPITNQYNPLTYTLTNTTANLTAPANTSFVRFQIVFQGDANNSNGSMYFDDLSLTPTAGAPYGNWNLVWSDEFNGTAINPKVWTYDTGTGTSGWGNSELEYYTSRATNAFVSGGVLHLVARQESYSGASYTSARLKTQGLYTKTYGRFEFRARLPQGVGFWPALWLLGANITSVSWPACGEIDVMENAGGALTNVQGSLHSGSDETKVYTFPNDSVTNFHTYLLEWTTNAFNWFVDGLLYQTQTNWSSTLGAYPAPFNQPCFLIMNLAVGGSYVGNPTPATINANSIFPGEMQVDYVRIYDLTAPLQLAISRLVTGARLSWPTNIVGWTR